MRFGLRPHVGSAGTAGGRKAVPELPEVMLSPQVRQMGPNPSEAPQSLPIPGVPTY